MNLMQSLVGTVHSQVFSLDNTYAELFAPLLAVTPASAAQLQHFLSRRHSDLSTCPAA